jgi:hypothetical protein
MSDNVHYNIEIKVTKVEFKTEQAVRSPGGGYQTSPTEKRIVSEAGHVNIKHTDFDAAKRLAGAHLDLLTEFTGSDPRKGTTRS